MEQPAFRPESGDLERKIQAVFADGEDASLASEMLAAYEPLGSEDADRIRLAALYISGGSLDRLERAIDDARIDWRDVLVAAEYRAYTELPLDASQDDRDRAIRADWDRYTPWVEEG